MVNKDVAFSEAVGQTCSGGGWVGMVANDK